jgi:hypothetical protein
MNRHNAEYDVRFRPSIIAYKSEICRRQELTTPCAIPTILFDMLAGNNPEAEISDYLDMIIERLPK